MPVIAIVCYLTHYGLYIAWQSRRFTLLGIMISFIARLIVGEAWGRGTFAGELLLKYSFNLFTLPVFCLFLSGLSGLALSYININNLELHNRGILPNSILLLFFGYLLIEIVPVVFSNSP
jgi:hypothetical protein